MTRERVNLHDLVAQARATGARGESSKLLTAASCALVLDALDIDADASFDALVTA
ncbi:MAG: hypothetical protein F2812_03810, partial [Actinobacteria bacterium]|nr:hypothetical protein [Actinomycetota bacterium]